MLRQYHLIAAAMLTIRLSTGVANAEDCGLLDAGKKSSEVVMHDVAPRDLIELRDFGSVDGGSQEPAFSVSPGGHFAALQIRRARITSNSYCFGIVVIDLRGEKPPRYLDIGGEWIPDEYDYSGLALAQVGAPQLIVPQWSPDGRYIAYLRRDNGITQLWLASLEGGSPTPITHGSLNILDFQWAPNGQSIVFSQYDVLPAALEAREQEGDRGFLYGDRFIPITDNRPFIRGPLARSYYRLMLSGLSVRSITPAEYPLPTSQVSDDIPISSQIVAKGRQGAVAWLAPMKDSFALSSMILGGKLQNAKNFSCLYPVCKTGLRNVWWVDGGKEVIFLRREGFAESQMALYRWRPGKNTPHRLMVTDDLLSGCRLLGNRLYCGHETSAHPRTLISIDINTGRIATVFEPNPQFTAVALGKVQRLYWKSPAGTEVFGDLILPRQHQPSQRLPLIIVQYESRGFLRGGTGDEFPIQLFASRNYAVLSFNRPVEVAFAQGFSNYADFEKYNARGWADKRNVLGSILTGIDILARRNLIDIDRIGITGFSDGSAITRFALINSNRFAAAALGTNCGDYNSALTLVGPKSADHSGRYQYAPLSEPDLERNRPASLVMNAKALNIPILMQLPDHEYICALESYTALREQNQPTEMYVFPDEYHIKAQPAHRLAIYERNLDWFDFWLLNKENTTSDREVEYIRWRALRSQRPSPKSPRGGRFEEDRSDQ